MAKVVSKKLVKETIDLSREYYDSHDSFLCRDLIDKGNETFGDDYSWVDDIITGITCKQNNPREDYETYYKVLTLLGFEIKEN